MVVSPAVFRGLESALGRVGEGGEGEEDRTLHAGPHGNEGKDLVSKYSVVALTQGVTPVVPQLRARWFSDWRRRYGLSLRGPNRKYKVAKWLVSSRYETMILNVARVRAATAAIFGYDPHVLNWGQSPFHHNETGAAEAKSLAVKGSIVPLVEGHDDAKARWTANLCVTSDVDGLRRDGPPPAEMMFKGATR